MVLQKVESLDHAPPCTTQHLNTVKNNLRALEAICASREATLYEIIKSFTMETESELLRLREHPEIFSDEVAKEEFWRHVYRVSISLADKCITIERSHDHCHKNIREASVKNHHQEVLPTRHPSRKPWEQFLHNKGPGSGLKLLPVPRASFLSAVGSRVSVQVVPAAAVRLLLAYKEEVKEINQEIKTVSVTRPNYGS